MFNISVSLNKTLSLKIKIRRIKTVSWLLQIQLGLFASIVILSPVFSTNTWKVIPASKETQPFEVWVKAAFNQAHYSNCGGVILNDRYILTIYRCVISISKSTILISKNIRIIVNYVNSHVPKNRKDQDESEYDIEEVWPSNFDEYFGPLYFFALLRTERPIEFHFNIKCINFPIGKSIWKNPSGIPNNREFRSSYWCKRGRNYQVFIKTGVRNCSDNVLLHTPRWLIPSCLEDPKDLKCYWPFGSPLLYNNTLIGMRNYEGKSASPFNKISYDMFLNVAQYTYLIMDHMRDYTPCTSDLREN